jgi:hypothetical protein
LPVRGDFDVQILQQFNGLLPNSLCNGTGNFIGRIRDKIAPIQGMQMFNSDINGCVHNVRYSTGTPERAYGATPPVILKASALVAI